MSVTHIFFDLGSTLVDETECYKVRYQEMIDGTNIPKDIFEKKVKEFAAEDKKGDHEAARFYNLNIPKWHKELECLYPEVEALLEYLTDKGYKLGIIANQSLGTEDRLCKWGITKYFSVVLASAEEGVSKPEPEMFLRALDRAQVLPENSVMIGDRIDNDIIPAQKLGMKTVWIKQGFAKYSKTISVADHTVNCLEEIKEIFN